MIGKDDVEPNLGSDDRQKRARMVPRPISQDRQANMQNRHYEGSTKTEPTM
jgi:hypothetical protein